MGYGNSLQLGSSTNLPFLLLPPWQGSLAVPKMRTGCCELSFAKAKTANLLLTTHQMGPVGFMKASFRSCELSPEVAGVKGKLSPANSVLGWLQACADVGGKGSEHFASFFAAPLFTQLLAEGTSCFEYLCLWSRFRLLAVSVQGRE